MENIETKIKTTPKDFFVRLFNMKSHRNYNTAISRINESKKAETLSTNINLERNEKVSVVTVLYNSTGVIEKLLDSINETNKDGLIREIIVVDNNSQDNGVRIVEEYIVKHKRNLRYEIKLIRNDENLGFGKGNNVGVMSATSPFVLFANPDVEFKANVVAEMIDLLNRNPKIGLLGPRICFDKKIMRITPIINPPVFVLRNFIGNTTLGKLLGIKPVQLGEYRKVLQISGAFMMLRINEFLEVGGFDEENFLYMEEFHLSERLKKVGLKTVKLWTSKEVGHLQAHSKFINTNNSCKSHPRKIDLYRQAEEHYVKNYMQIITGNSVLDFIIRQTIKLIYKRRNNSLIRPIYKKWLRLMAKDVILDHTVR